MGWRRIQARRNLRWKRSWKGKIRHWRLHSRSQGAGKLENIGKMALLSGGPLRRGAEEGKSERLMIGKKSKLTGFEEKTELAD